MKKTKISRPEPGVFLFGTALATADDISEYGIICEDPRNKGSLTVEAAIVFPLIILMFMALFQFGLIAAVKLVTIAAAHASARTACVFPTQKPAEMSAAMILGRIGSIERSRSRSSYPGNLTATELHGDAILTNVDCLYDPIFPLPQGWLGSSGSRLIISSSFWIHDEVTQ